MNLESEEVNQYYLAAELMDDIEANSAKMQAELDENPAKFQTKKSYLPQDNYLTDLTEELNQAIYSCVEQHQMLMEFSEMMEDFFSVFILLKSFQTTFQICNLVFTFSKVSGLFSANICEIQIKTSLFFSDRRNRSVLQHEPIFDLNIARCFSTVLLWWDVKNAIISH